MRKSGSVPKKPHDRTGVVVLALVAVVVGIVLVRLTPGRQEAGAEARGPKKVVVDSSPETQRARKKVIKQLISAQVFDKVDQPLTRPHVYVADAWRLLDDEEKRKALGVVLAYYNARDSRADIVIIRDATTEERIGIFSERGLELD